MLKHEYLSRLNASEKGVVILSGGMDSTIALRLSIEKYGIDNVHAISYYYQQRQSVELECAKKTCDHFGIKHVLIDIGFLGEIAKNISSNVVDGLEMPTIKDVLGDPSPPTEVPNRNSILLMIAVSYAQANRIGTVVTGLQSQDQYSYWDTSETFIEKINLLLDEIRQNPVHVSAPFTSSNKAQEIQLLLELDGNVDLLKNTVTCYDPSPDGVACGICPSCSERISNFMKCGIQDPIPYSIDINW